MEIAALVLEYLKVFLSTPPVSAAVAIFFLLLFRDPLKALIGRTREIKFPGGEWSSASQAERTAEAEAATGQETSDSPGFAAPGSSPPQALTLNQEQQERLADFLKAERARAAYWEYRYLDLYLVPHTQASLGWLAGLPSRVTIQFYDSVWGSAIPNPDERKAMLEALRNHHLVQAQGDLLEVTPKGREYLAHRASLGPAAEDE